jgi:exodeoxyribonuclease-3
MKLATFNINYVNKRLPNLLAWLKAAKPGIVCLQELKAEQDAFPAAALARNGYKAAWVGQRSWNGVAILSRGYDIHVTRDRLPGGRSLGQAEPVSRGCDWRHRNRLHLSAERQPSTGPKIRLQARLVRASDPARALP